MVKYKANHNFKGIKEKKRFEAGEEYDITVSRAEEINEKLERNYNIKNALERVNPPKSENQDKSEEE